MCPSIHIPGCVRFNPYSIYTQINVVMKSRCGQHLVVPSLSIGHTVSQCMCVYLYACFCVCHLLYIFISYVWLFFYCCRFSIEQIVTNFSHEIVLTRELIKAIQNPHFYCIETLNYIMKWLEYIFFELIIHTIFYAVNR